jgi:hypothetical protein
MKAFISALLVKRALLTSTFAALFLGLLAIAPAYGQDSQKERKANLDTILSARQTSPPDSGTSERAPLVTGTELLSDGGFEAGSGTSAFTNVSGAWTWQYGGSSGTSTPRYSGAAHTGNWSLYFDLGPSTNRIYQTVSIPSGVTATLSFWLRIGTSETTTSVPYDTLKVSIADTSGVALGGATYSNLDASVGYVWAKQTFDVSAWAGRTVRIQADTYEDSTGDTIFMIDDVSLLASASNASCVEDAYTMCLGGGRYKVTCRWRNQYVGETVTTPMLKTDLTDVVGAFWKDAGAYQFFVSVNPATAALNGHTWVAMNTFSGVEFWIDVTDTVSGQSREYHNPPENKTLVEDRTFFVYP